MSRPSQFRNAAGKAGSLLLRFLDTVAFTGSRMPKVPELRIQQAVREKPKPRPTDLADRYLQTCQSAAQESLQPSHSPAATSSQRPPASAFAAYQEPQQPSTAQRSSARLDLAGIRKANIIRQAEWCPDQLPDLSFRGVELAGETGEACNVIKKLERERYGWRGSRSSKEKLAEELADVVNCADLCALAAGIDLADAFVTKWNATSTANGLKTFIGPSLDTLPERWEDDNREVTNHYARRDAAERTLTRLGYRWHGGEEWKPPLGKPPHYVVSELEPGTAENLRDAIAFVLDDHNPDGLEWLRSWDEGDPAAMRELDEWRARMAQHKRRGPKDEEPTPSQLAAREEARARQVRYCPGCGAAEGLSHAPWCPPALKS